jgi:hypothetical protein
MQTLSRRVNANVVALWVLSALAALIAAAMLPATGLADSGGAALGGGSATGAAGTPIASVTPGNVSVTATGGGITLTARSSTILRHQLRFTGTVPSPAAGQTVEIQRLDPKSGWLATTTGTVAPDGSFTAAWRTNRIGRLTFRVSFTGGRLARTTSSDPAPTLSVTVYRPAIATIYGTGFYGQQTACGQTLTPTMIGTAHRTLKCGTLVAVYFHGKTMIVPVIDRGPYANHADWDLTEATASALGMDGTHTIGAVSLRR